ncbi:hypothetical protein MRX96_007563 [Rhipicephalus microplus]
MPEASPKFLSKCIKTSLVLPITRKPFGPALAGGSWRMHPRVAVERNTAGTPPYKRRLLGLPSRPTATSRRHAHGAAALNDVLMPVHCDGAR